VRGQSGIDVGKYNEHALEAGVLENRPNIFLHADKRKLAAVLARVLHRDDQHRQSRAVEVGDFGQIDNQVRGMIGDDGA